MRVPLSWLAEYVPLEMPLADLADRLAVASAEVEQLTARGVADEGGNLGLFRVGRVLEAVKHPNADRLRLCQVDVGEPEPRSIVCGAWNFEAGATVCVALPGATLPIGITLERRKIRGEVSDGMILAEDEIDLGTDHDGIMHLQDDLEPGRPLVDVFSLSDRVLEVELTGNRPDLQSVYGLAREIAALFDLPLAPMPGVDPPLVGDDAVEIAVDDVAGCPRYVGRLVRDVTIAPSPWWLKARLRSAGSRPISNVVDITNYAMLALGSPLHAFDLDRLAGGRIGVRRATPGERLVTLDGTERTLATSDLVITDAARAVALAGIMGGLESEVGETTRDVLLECAYFEPTGIMATSERLALRTEASNRFEKGVDPTLPGPGSVLATQLLVELCGGRFTGHTDARVEFEPPPSTTLRPARASAIVGVEIPAAEQAAGLRRLGFEVDDSSEPWRVVVPTWRARDVSREVDLVEEVARLHGLERVPFTLPARRELFGRLTQDQRLRRIVEDVLVGCGLSEAYTWSLVARDEDPRALRLPEPLSAEHAILRTSLVHGLVDAACRNVDAGNAEIGLFEVARVYLPGEGQLPDERWRAGGIVEGGFFEAKGVVETLHAALDVPLAVTRGTEPWLHPGKAARCDAGWLGELHPALLEGSWGAFEIDLATLFAGVPERTLYEDVITFPAVRQDLAFVVREDVLAGELIAAAREAAGEALRVAEVFDVYRGAPVPDDSKSVAIRVEFQAPDRTLSDDDARALRELIVAALTERFGAELRSGDVG